MNVDELRNYSKWIGQSPAQILLHVIQVNGWGTVFNDPKTFPDGLPFWAHRLRNWFNDSPRTLCRLGSEDAEERLNAAKKFQHKVECSRALQVRKERAAGRWMRDGIYFQTPKAPGNCRASDETVALPNAIDEFAHVFALSGDVYVDELRRTWFQMNPGGAIYHYGRSGKLKAEAIPANIHGQEFCPIFKLVSPDGTGGSRECIIQNLQRRKSVPGWNGTMMPVEMGAAHIGKESEPVDVSRIIVTNLKWVGSYNYGETVQAGMEKHNTYDIVPDDLAGTACYIEPPPQSTLRSRRFPESVGGQVLATQIKFLR